MKSKRSFPAPKRRYRKTRASARDIETILQQLRHGVDKRSIEAETGVSRAIVNTLECVIADSISLRSSFEQIKSFVLDLCIGVRKLRELPVGKVHENLLKIQVESAVQESKTVSELRVSVDRLGSMVEALLRMYDARVVIPVDGSLGPSAVA